MLTGVIRAGAWRGNRRRTLRRITQRPYAWAVLLGILVITESLAEFVSGDGRDRQGVEDRQGAEARGGDW